VTNVQPGTGKKKRPSIVKPNERGGQSKSQPPAHVKEKTVGEKENRGGRKKY